MVEKSIVELYQNGCSQEQITKLLHVGNHRASGVIREFLQTGQIPQPRKRGRKPKITEEMKNFIEVKTLLDASLSSVSLATEVENNFGQSITSQYVSKLRNEMRFHFRPPKHEQHLSEEQIRNRKNFCEKMLQQEFYLDKIAFSDESRFVLGKDNRWIWVRKGDFTKNSIITETKFPQSIMVFGVIANNYKSKLIIVDSSINSEKYISNMEESEFIENMDRLHGKLGWLYMQDGARCHTAQETLDWLESQINVITDWPANSPDLNPIELLWAILKRAVAEENPKSKDELKKIVEKTWNGLSLRLINKLCLSFINRLKLCLEMDGLSISRFLNFTKDFKEAVIQGRRTDPWSKEEDEILYKLIRLHGHQWKIISRKMENRNPLQCKNRWFSSLRFRQEKFLENELSLIMVQ